MIALKSLEHKEQAMGLEAKGVRTIAITGAGSGIGRAVALACARRGDKVVALDISSQAVAKTAEESLAAGAAGALGLVCDVCDEAQLEAAFAQACDAFGAPYGVFANAGIDIGGLIHEMPLERWDRVLRTNLTGIFLTCKHGLRQMLGAKVRGSLVCSSSPAGFVAQAAGSCGAYSATKGGISSLVRCMAIDYAPYGIRVNAVVPGATETGMTWNNVAPASVEAMRAQLYREIPLGRLGEPEDPARAVLWLLSDESDYVTGSHLVCDGGILAKSSISV
jgi:NAD(P)-dependent dehydrogenase (short-subunit alcohol dehydrogenase family)